MDYESTFMTTSPHERKKKDLIKKRIHNLESSMYSYEASKSKGSWRKDNPKAAALLDHLLKAQVDETVKEVETEIKSESGPDKGPAGAAPKQATAESQATGSNQGTDKSEELIYTKNAPKVYAQSWTKKKK